MSLTRRSLIGGMAALAPALAAPAIVRAQESLASGGAGDQGAAFAEALDRASRAGRPLVLQPGPYVLSEITLPEHAHIVGVPGETRLVLAAGRALLAARDARRIRLEGLILDGRDRALPERESGLVHIDGADEIIIEDCTFLSSGACGLTLRRGAGRISGSRFAGAAEVGLYLSDSAGMSVLDNAVEDCGNTGILVERGDKGRDGTILRGNRVSRIAARSGGSGQYGNGINLSRADEVLVAGNVVADCAFSAFRAYSSDGAQVSGNALRHSGETALYVEFASRGAIVSDNIVEDAGYGISFANLDEGGRLAICSGNLVRDIRREGVKPDGTATTNAGIGAEADIAINGNVIENAGRGLELGWGPYLRDVSATGNLIRDTEIGISVSVAEGAGAALVSGNLISGAREAAIRGYRWSGAATGDLAISGADDFPHLTIAGNRIS